MEGGLLSGGPAEGRSLAASEFEPHPGWLAETMKTHETPGVAVAVLHDHRVESVGAFGLRSAPAASPLRAEHAMQCGSISKPATALALLRNFEAQGLALDTPLFDLLDSVPLRSSMPVDPRAVTVRRTLCHAAGFNNAGYVGYRESPIPTLQQVIDGEAPATTEAVSLVETPGERWCYSGGGYVLMTRLLEERSDCSFEEAMQSALFEPAGMTGASFEQPPADCADAGLPIAHLAGTALEPARYPELGAAGLWATARDVAQLALALQRSLRGDSRALLGPAFAREMVTPQIPMQSELDPNAAMGLGLCLFCEGDDATWFWHTGGTLGFASLMVGDACGDGHGIAILTNALPGGRPLAWKIAARIAAAYGWRGWKQWGAEDA